MEFHVADVADVDQNVSGHQADERMARQAGARQGQVHVHPKELRPEDIEMRRRTEKERGLKARCQAKCIER